MGMGNNCMGCSYLILGNDGKWQCQKTQDYLKNVEVKYGKCLQPTTSECPGKQVGTWQKMKEK